MYNFTCIKYVQIKYKLICNLIKNSLNKKILIKFCVKLICNYK